jgi:hypothetical protein
MRWLAGWCVVLGALAVPRSSSAQAPAGDPPGDPPPPGAPSEPPTEPPAAEAQPPPAEAPPPPPPAVPPSSAPIVEPAGIETGYPRAFAARPLVLPQGGLEGTASFGYHESAYDSVTAAARTRYSLGVAEVEAGVGLILDQERPEGLPIAEPDLLDSFFFAARYAVHSDLTVGGQLQLSSFDNVSYSPRAVVANKRHFASSSLELGLAAGIDHRAGTAQTPSFDVFDMAATVRAQAQVAPAVMVEAHGVVGYSNTLGETMFGFDDYTYQTYGFRLLLAATDAIDIAADADVVYSRGEDTATLFVLSLIARRVP